MSKDLILLQSVALIVSVLSAVLLGQDISGPAGIVFVIGGALDTVGFAIIFALILAVIYGLFKRKPMPRLNIAIWLLWGLFAVLNLVGNLTSSVAANEKQQAKQQLQEMLAFTTKQTTPLNDLALRFEKVDLTAVLSVENITSRFDLATARVTIAQFCALLAERRLLVQTYLAEVNRYMSELPTGNFKAGAMSAIFAQPLEKVKVGWHLVLLVA